VTFFSASRYWDIGPLCLNVYSLAGTWISAGIHLSIWPLYADFHIGWWVISLMSRKRGEWLREVEHDNAGNCNA
jgi:hypothetical protein